MNKVESPKKRKGSCLGMGLVVLLVLILGLGLLWWWHNRPIRPVELSVEEKQAVEEKVGAITRAEPVEPEYEKGAKEIVLTERELNGLLNERTTLGDKVRFELATGAIHARVETDLDPDLPVVGGKRLKARARFLLSNDEGGPHFVIDDVTVWGVSLPNDWLGGLKGRDLIAETLGSGSGLPGVETIEVVPGEIRVELKD